MNNNTLAEATIIMPVGGKATRAIDVTRDRIPKHLISLGEDQTVLRVICRALQYVGFRRFVFCVGHHSEQILAYLENNAWQLSDDTSYEASKETQPLGPDGAVLDAVRRLGISGSALVLPGDTMLPWNAVAAMVIDHAQQNTPLTFGVTSIITERNSAGATYVVDDENTLLAHHPKGVEAPNPPAGIRHLKSAAATVIEVEAFVRLCEAYELAHPDIKELNLRHAMLPWLLVSRITDLRAYDLGGEALDIGTPPNIRHAQENWRSYVYGK